MTAVTICSDFGAQENINHFRYADDATLMPEIEEELNSLLMRVKRRVKKLA